MHRSEGNYFIEGQIMAETELALRIKYYDPQYKRWVIGEWFPKSQILYIGRDTIERNDQVYCEFHVTPWIADKKEIVQDCPVPFETGRFKSESQPKSTDDYDDDIPF